MDYRREIDGLRALAVLPVIFFHAGLPLFSGGFVGVDVFFVISGYLITSIILAEKQAGTFTLINFYERRARRILPALFVVVIACLPFAWLWLLQDDLKEFSGSVFSVSTFISNVFFWRNSGYFDTAAELKPLLHTWSLAVEEQYYLFFPVFLMLTWQLGKRWILAMLAALAVISLAAAQWGSVNNPAAAFYLLPTRGWELLVGAFVAFYFAKSNKPDISRSVGQAGSTVGLLLIIYAVFAFDKQTPFPSLYTLAPTIGASLIILCATPQTVVGKILGNQLFVGVGLISYSAYLWHQPLLAFARHRSLEEPSGLLLAGLAAVSLALAYVSWKYVEVPFRRRGFVGRSRIFSLALVGTVSLLLIGVVGYTQSGFPDRLRFSEKQQAILEKQAADTRSRFANIKPDICHFTNLSNIGVDGFIDQWRCKEDPLVPDSKRIPLIIAGDSNAADLVVVFKLNALMPAHMTGAGCELVPRKMSLECKKLFERLYLEVAGDDYYEYLALTSLFSRDELGSDAIREMLEYWSRFNKKLILFTGTPRFPKHQEYVLLGLEPKIDLQADEVALDAEALALLKQGGVYLVDRNKYFCAINHCRYFSKEGQYLIADARGEHLSAEGAKLFGEALLRDDFFFHRWKQ